MKNNITIIYFLFFIALLNSQEIEYQNGTIITNELDTLNVKIRVLDNAQSIVIIKYINKEGKRKKIHTSKVKSYTRGNENFKTITISNTYKLFGKQTLKGVNFNIISRIESGQNFNAQYGTSSPGLLNDQNLPYSHGQAIDYTSSFLENKYGRSIKIPSSKKKFRKKISKFLLEYADISERVRNGKLIDINEIVNLCNKL